MKQKPLKALFWIWIIIATIFLLFESSVFSIYSSIIISQVYNAAAILNGEYKKE